jgi:PASTA domain
MFIGDSSRLRTHRLWGGMDAAGDRGLVMWGTQTVGSVPSRSGPPQMRPPKVHRSGHSRLPRMIRPTAARAQAQASCSGCVSVRPGRGEHRWASTFRRRRPRPLDPLIPPECHKPGTHGDPAPRSDSGLWSPMMRRAGRRPLLFVAVAVAVVVGGWLIIGNEKGIDGSPTASTAPNVTGMRLHDAYITLTDAGLRVGHLAAEHSDSATGTVLAQGSTLTGGTVSLVVSAGLHPHPIGIERLVGVGGTCDVTDTKPQSEPCVGGPLLVPLVLTPPSESP